LKNVRDTRVGKVDKNKICNEQTFVEYVMVGIRKISLVKIEILLFVFMMA
jgi:hypothetical protein